MISRAVKTNRLIRLFGLTKVPMIWYCRPKVIEHTDEKIEIRIPLKRRTKNHLGSMYFGVLAVGADITGGFLAMDPIQESGRNIALIFKDFKADFLKRPEGDVHFICRDGMAIKELVKIAAVFTSSLIAKPSLHIKWTSPSGRFRKSALKSLNIKAMFRPLS